MVDLDPIFAMPNLDPFAKYVPTIGPNLAGIIGPRSKFSLALQKLDLRCT